MACLIIAASPEDQAGKYFQLSKRPLAGGRDPAREIQLLDPHVSRKHFLIRQEGDVHIISEARARNGLLVNGRPVTEKKLADGDRIEVGETVLIYSVFDSPPQRNAVNEFRAADRYLREDATLTLRNPSRKQRKG